MDVGSISITSMDDGLLAFLKHVGPFIKFTRSYSSQKSFKFDSDREELKSPISKKLS